MIRSTKRRGLWIAHLDSTMFHLMCQRLLRQYTPTSLYRWDAHGRPYGRRRTPARERTTGTPMLVPSETNPFATICPIKTSRTAIRNKRALAVGIEPSNSAQLVISEAGPNFADRE